MSKMHSYQFYCILVLSGAWSVICIPALYGSGQLLGIGAACLLQMLLCIPMLALTRQQGSFRKLVASHKFLGILYICFFILWGAQGFVQLWETSPVHLIPDSGTFTASVLIILTCLYTSSVGLTATARCAPFVMGLYLISILVLLLGAWKRIDASIISFHKTGFWEGMTVYHSLSGELIAAWILLDKIKSHQKVIVNAYLITKAFFCILILALCLWTGGRLTALSSYPFFTLTALSQPLQGQRADALYILLFVMLYIMHITLQTSIIGYLTESMFPAVSRYAAPVSLLFMLLLAWLTSYTFMQAVTSAALPLLLFVIPIILRMKQFFKNNSDSKKYEEHSYEAL